MRRILTFLLVASALVFSFTAFAQRQRIDLQGQWNFSLDPDGKGEVAGFPTAHFTEMVTLPGTTDTNRKGYFPTRTDETTNLSRLHSYVGKAWYLKEVYIPQDWKGKEICLELERSRPSTVWVDGVRQGSNDNISTPQRYDLSTSLALPGRHTIAVMVDNGESVPPELLVSSHAYTEATQTNWNGIIGEIFLEASNKLNIRDLQLYPDAANRNVGVRFSISAPQSLSSRSRVKISARSWNTDSVQELPAKTFALRKGQSEYNFDYSLGPEALLWSEFSPALYHLEVEIEGVDKVEADFGLREFKAEGTQFTINGTTTFLRGKHDGCVFPLTGHTAMDVPTWRHYFQVAKSYGINHYRFHSWCPPRACFEAADIEGVYLQPELPFWGNLRSSNERLISFLSKEGVVIQKEYGSHASFVLFALGNELSGELEVMKNLAEKFRAVDSRHLYAYGSNIYLGYQGFISGQDFLVTCRIGREGEQSFETHTRGSFSFADTYDGGYLNHTYPNTLMDFSGAIASCPVPVISHETGQFQVYPNYEEIGKYKGVLYPYNFEVFRHKLAQAGMMSQAEDFFLSSGAWAVELYKAEIEMDLRTPGFGGFQLLDLQDYPGQGTALVGILDAFMDSKGLVSPERWRGFCSETVPLLLVDKFCYHSDEAMRARVKISNYSPNSLKGRHLQWSLKSPDGSFVDGGSLDITLDGQGLLDLGRIEPYIAGIHKASKLSLELSIVGTPYRNSYSLWVYPVSEVGKIKSDPSVLVTRSLNESAIGTLKSGGKVLWMPRREDFSEEQCVGGLFQTDYWNYRMFKGISEANKKPVSPGTMGLLVDPAHPFFASFPTECHTNWQWFSIVKSSFPLIMDSFPTAYRPVVQVIDNIERNHRLGLVFELCVEGGKLLVCMADLESSFGKPEVRAFYNSMIDYMASPAFEPSLSLSATQLEDLLSAKVSGTELKELKNISYE